MEDGRRHIDIQLEEEYRSHSHLFIRHNWSIYLPRPCFIIASVMFVFIALSLILGIFFTASTKYSMGDSFTLAGYVIAVGGLICSFLLACHFSNCKCWKEKLQTTREAGEGGEEIELKRQDAVVVGN
jgi:hypothetical protein